ncbi:MAG: hypothetical protein WA634_12865 [Silvibacterium sp.]
MASIILPIFASAVLFVLYLLLAAMLLRKYKSTGDKGFLWLGLAVVLWPLASNLMAVGAQGLLDRSLHGHLVGVFPFSLVQRKLLSVDSLVECAELVRRMVGLVLLMIAVVTLSRAAERAASEAPVQPKRNQN